MIAFIFNTNIFRFRRDEKIVSVTTGLEVHCTPQLICYCSPTVSCPAHFHAHCNTENPTKWLFVTPTFIQPLIS